MTDGKTPRTGSGVVTFQQLELLADIEAHEPDAKSVWYSHSILTSTIFPATQPARGTDFVSQQNGTYTYLLEAGVDGAGQRAFPAGKYPRLIMAWMAKQIRSAGGRKTATVDPETRTIIIPSIYQLLEDMGVTRGGRTADAVQEQLRLLLACRISIRRSTGFSGRTMQDIVYWPIVEAVRTVDDENGSLFSGAAFKLTEEVYNRLASESAPFDMRASAFLLSGRSVLPWDLYVWINGSMKELKHPLPITWDWLRERFGGSISSDANFRATFRRALEKVRQVYPSMNVEVNRKGIILFPSPTTIAPRGQKRRGLTAGEESEK